MVEVKRDFLQRKYTEGQDDTKVDARLFNRREGAEIVPMIQKVVDHLGGRHHHIHYVEDLIAEQLPSNVRGKEKVFDWLVKRLDR